MATWDVSHHVSTRVVALAGPDCITVEPGQTLNIFTVDEKMRLVRLVNDEDETLLEMSGEVVVNVDRHLAEILDVPCLRQHVFCAAHLRVSSLNLLKRVQMHTTKVDVDDLELKSFGSYSKRYVLWALPIIVMWHWFRWAISIKLEDAAVEGQCLARLGRNQVVMGQNSGAQGLTIHKTFTPK